MLEEDMKMDIDELSEKELIERNQRIVEKLKFLDSVSRHKEMIPGFKILDDTIDCHLKAHIFSSRTYSL
jgi:hypothetical protein